MMAAPPGRGHPVCGADCGCPCHGSGPDPAPGPDEDSPSMRALRARMAEENRLRRWLRGTS
ncbi:hypothetical protein C0Q64_12425 [Streptomyces albidoflavus]|nr:hypothetical protein C0Q64_12425 [Streptomyces albidoflavus]RZE03054.1 hypothetical protein C0Q65_12750 [Streptomyces albidoflavus]